MTAVRGAPRDDGGDVPPAPRLRPPAHHVSRRAIAHWTIEYVLVFGLAFGLALGVAAWAGSADWTGTPGLLARHAALLPVVIGVAGTLTAAIAPVWRYRVHRWEVSADVVYTRTGWFDREWLLVPVGRIQTATAGQGWLERLLGLATVEINTASHTGSSELTGLPVDVAVRLAADLAHRAHDLRDDAT
ncbi:Bacterial membrane flanked domain protein [Actinomadura rubteroloni]|uniref:Bacterial membrane flanked domain protein n=1 Tax=Actinomadura rubteroloni TaxID=1926885 RepID=A0A2P4UCS9_9ACTN|nr:PH domain-containing protein [Actinomadura rubteroloni]POM22850.1 Bacterial membrane flanked domain protein [Actinomadura rubteroloni]